MTRATDRLHTAVRKMKKECELLREDVHCRFTMLKGKWSIESTQLVDQFSLFREQSERKVKSKMGELIDELDIKEK